MTEKKWWNNGKKTYAKPWFDRQIDKSKQVSFTVLGIPSTGSYLGKSFCEFWTIAITFFDYTSCSLLYPLAAFSTFTQSLQQVICKSGVLLRGPIDDSTCAAIKHVTENCKSEIQRVCKHWILHEMCQIECLHQSVTSKIVPFFLIQHINSLRYRSGHESGPKSQAPSVVGVLRQRLEVQKWAVPQAWHNCLIK